MWRYKNKRAINRQISAVSAVIRRRLPAEGYPAYQKRMRLIESIHRRFNAETPLSGHRGHKILGAVFTYPMPPPPRESG